VQLVGFLHHDNVLSLGWQLFFYLTEFLFGIGSTGMAAEDKGKY
jgi:hypothetical protein